MRTAPNAVSPLTAFAVATLGIAIFSSMDAVMKGLVLALGAYNALTWRMIAGTALSVVPFALSRPRRPSPAVLRIHILRAFVSAAMAFLFFWGLGRVPLAQGIALAFIAPIIALFLAALILKEKLHRTALVASVMALAGVLVILYGQSRADLGPNAFWGALSILASAICYAWNIILMRQQSLLANATEVAFYQSAFVALVFLAAAPFLLTLPPLDLVPALILAALLATSSLFLLAWAYARAEAGYLAPTEYTGFIWATLWGWIVFGEHVSLFTVAGAALIVGACILAARRSDHAPVADRQVQLS